MSLSHEFQREAAARTKHERSEAILAAARELASEQHLREISLGDIARRVGLAKSNLLRYFESREDLFLHLLLRSGKVGVSTSFAAEIGRLNSELDGNSNLPDDRRTPTVLRPDQRDVCCPRAQRLGRRRATFKSQSLDKVDDLGSVVAKRMPALGEEYARETIAAALVVTAGLWPIANPAPHVTATFLENPALTRAHVDFEDRLRQSRAR